jgi:hypothetical protein
MDFIYTFLELSGCHINTFFFLIYVDPYAELCGLKSKGSRKPPKPQPSTSGILPISVEASLPIAPPSPPTGSSDPDDPLPHNPTFQIPPLPASNLWQLST